MNTAKGLVVPAGGGQHLDMSAPGRFAALKLLGHETNESIMLFEETVLAGEITFRIGDEVSVGGPGTCAFFPRNIPHAWKNTGSETGRVVFLYTPAAAGGYVEELLNRPGPMNDDERKQLRERYRWEVVGPKEEITMATTLSTWTIDPVHSSVQFSLDYMGFSTYRTGFRELEGSLEFDAARPAASSVKASIAVPSVDVTNDRLMSRLMDPDLLGGKDHPTITFKSTRVEALDPAHWKVTGDLTIHGMTRPVVLDTRYLGQAMHPFSKKLSAAFRAETTIDRRDFGVTWNAAMDTGGAYLGERVQISLTILAARQD